MITSLEMSHKDLIVSSYNGFIRCIDCERLELKWCSYHISDHITASVMIGDRLILGNQEGLIHVTYLDSKMVDCDLCGVTFARQVDLKEHIKQEHPIDSSDGQQ